MAKTSTTTELDDNRIRQAIWMLNHKGATKKAACEFIGIAYNTKRLEKIIEEYSNKVEREKELRAKNKNKSFTKLEIDAIIKDYVSGSAISNISKSLFVSDYKIKKVLTENNVPLRSRGKKKPAITEHVEQDLDVKFKVGDKVFYAKQSSFAIVQKVYDEELIEKLEDPLRESVIEHKSNIYNNKGIRVCSEENMKEDIHYTTYNVYDNNYKIKRSAAEHMVELVNNTLLNTGREAYLIWILGDYARFQYATRDSLFPIKEN